MLIYVKNISTKSIEVFFMTNKSIYLTCFCCLGCALASSIFLNMINCLIKKNQDPIKCQNNEHNKSKATHLLIKL